jgi:undecaprenyl-diphosphatase
MNYLEAVFVALVQGVSELFPISSLGHAVVLLPLLGLSIDQRAEGFLPFLVLLHLGTATALLIYFWRDWWDLARAVLGLSPPEERRVLRRLLLMMIVATIPAAVLGFLLNHPLRQLFGVPLVAAGFLVVNGFVLWGGEKLRTKVAASQSKHGRLDALSWRGAFAIGVWQCLALLPGISRSGTTMIGGLLAGLNHEASAHFSFLIATPIIVGASILELPKLLRPGSAEGFGGPAVLGGLIAGVAAYVSIVILMRYFRRHDFAALNPFAYYCWVFGALCLFFLR